MPGAAAASAQYAVVVAGSLFSLLAGASTVHLLLRPDLKIDLEAARQSSALLKAAQRASDGDGDATRQHPVSPQE